MMAICAMNSSARCSRYRTCRLAVRLNPRSYGVDGPLTSRFAFGVAADFVVLGGLAPIRSRLSLTGGDGTFCRVGLRTADEPISSPWQRAPLRRNIPLQLL
jgi:hypothetical protein